MQFIASVIRAFVTLESHSGSRAPSPYSAAVWMRIYASDDFDLSVGASHPRRVATYPVRHRFRKEILDGTGKLTNPEPVEDRSCNADFCLDEIMGQVFFMKQTTTHLRQFAIGSAAVGANALGALAVGAFALGALAIGRLVVGRLTVGKTNLTSASIEDLTIGRLQVRELTVTGSLNTPALNLLGDPQDRSR